MLDKIKYFIRIILIPLLSLLVVVGMIKGYIPGISFKSALAMAADGIDGIDESSVFEEMEQPKVEKEKKT